MDEKQIKEFMHQMDLGVPKDQAVAEFSAFGEVALYANKQGYLRMAIELMKCAFDDTQEEADLSYLFSKETDFGIDHLTFTKDQFKFTSR